MDKCKFCQQELEEGNTVCPHCGKDNAVEETAEKAQETAEVKEASKTEETAEIKEEPKAEETAEAEKEPKTEGTSEAEKKPADMKKGATPGQIAVAAAIIVALGALLIALIVTAVKQSGKPEAAETSASTAAAAEATQPAPIETTEPTIPADGNPEDATAKGTYTVSDEEAIAAAEEVVARIAEFELTNSELQVYYWKGIQAFLQNNPYAAYMVDVSKPLDTQVCPIAPEMTWQQFFLKNSLESWQSYQAMAAEAEINEVPEDPDLQKFLAELPGEIEKEAKENNFADGEAMLAANVGKGPSINDYVKFMDIFNRGYGYYLYFLEVADPDEAAMEKYFEEHHEELEEGGITKDAKSVNVRHILITPENTEDEGSWQEAETKANDLLKEFESGAKTEEVFAEMATEHTQDPGSKQTGGLYQNVVLGQMVPEFEGWCFDEARKVGDTGVVKTNYGYHIMFYSGDQSIWQDQVRQLYLSDKSDELMEKHRATYPLTVDYSKIVLSTPVMAE